MEAPMTPRTTYLAALLALACGSTAPDTTSPDLRPSPSVGGSLVGTAWVLTEIRGEPVLGNEEITLVVDESTAGGNSGCNYYGGTPQITVGTFRLDEIVATARACEDTRLMEQESDYLAILARTSAWEIDDETLHLRAETGETLVFREND
jgi:heat shock protein HslJ